MAIFGEIGLSGEIRGVSYTEQRIKEAIKLGFKKILIPKTTNKKFKFPTGAIIQEIGHLQDIEKLFRK